MKKRKTIKKTKPYASNVTEHRLTKLEGETRALDLDFRGMQKELDKRFEEAREYIKVNVLKAIEDTNADLKKLLDRKKEHEAIKNFLSHLLKLSCSFAALAWAVVEIVRYFKGN